MTDLEELQQLVLRERQGRDRAWWPQMAAAWHPQARIRISWFDGGPDDFVARSREMWHGGTRASHRLSPPVVEVRDGRALVEVPAVIEIRALLAGVEVDLASRTRLLYRAVRTRTGWLLAGLECLYESDAVVPVVPGTAPDMLPGEVRRPSYRWLAAVLEAGGHAVADDLPGDDRPETVAEVYHRGRVWLKETAAS